MTTVDCAVREVKEAIETILVSMIDGRGGSEWRGTVSRSPKLFRALEIVSDWSDYDREGKQFMIEVWGKDLYSKARRGEASEQELESAEESWWARQPKATAPDKVVVPQEA